MSIKEDLQSLEETGLPYDGPEFEEALAIAQEALDAASKLQDMQLDLEQAEGATKEFGEKCLNVAVESYQRRFEIPNAALESNEVDERNGFQKTIDYLYGLAKKLCQYVLDLLRNHRRAAREHIRLTKEFIGRADSLEAHSHPPVVTDRAVLTGLQTNGIVVKTIPQMYERLTGVFETQLAFTAVNETIAVISAAKDGDADRLHAKAEELREVLENGLKASLKKEANPKANNLIKMEERAHECYVSDVMFGQRYVVGAVAEKVSDEDTFFYQCGIRRDAEVPLRATSVEALSPDDIRLICRTALKNSESIIRNSRDEDLLLKAFRDIDFLATRSPTRETAKALRMYGSMTRNSYIAYLRLTSSVTRTLLRYCAISLKMYEKENDAAV